MLKNLLSLFKAYTIYDKINKALEENKTKNISQRK